MAEKKLRETSRCQPAGLEVAILCWRGGTNLVPRHIAVDHTMTTAIIYLTVVVVTFALLYVAAGLIFVNMRVLVHLASGVVRLLVLMFAREPRRRHTD